VVVDPPTAVLSEAHIGRGGGGLEGLSRKGNAQGFHYD